MRLNLQQFLAKIFRNNISIPMLSPLVEAGAWYFQNKNGGMKRIQNMWARCFDVTSDFRRLRIIHKCFLTIFLHKVLFWLRKCCMTFFRPWNDTKWTKKVTCYTVAKKSHVAAAISYYHEIVTLFSSIEIHLSPMYDPNSFLSDADPNLLQKATLGCRS